RRYAWERLLASDEADALRDRQRDWCIALGEEAEMELRGPRQMAWMARIETELDNIRAALAWCAERNRAAGLRLAGALGEFWWWRGHISEGDRWLTALLARPAGEPADDVPIVWRARALRAAAHVAYGQTDFRRAQILAAESIQRLRQI